MKRIDCDANATYSPDGEVLDLFREAFAFLSNPSAMHRSGQRAKSAIEKARSEILNALGAAKDDSLIFTSGATESNNTLPGVLSSKTDEVILHSFEHPCLLATFQQHEERHQGTVKVLSPTPSGDINVESVLRAITPRTKLISLMCANNETGVLYPVKQLTQAVKSVSSRILVHCDAAQLLGKGDLSFGELGVDAMTLSSHKIGALPGVGALIVKKGVHLQPMLVGGSQEMKLRGGTENVPGILVFSEVIKRILQSLPIRIESMKKARDAFERELQKSSPKTTIHFESSPRLPNTSNVLVPGMRADDLVVALDLVHVLASTGAACSSGKREPSHVLLAHGFSESVASSSVRFSFRADALPEEGAEVARRFSQIIDRFAKGSEAA